MRRFLPLVPSRRLSRSLPADAAPPRGDGEAQPRELRAQGLKAHLQALQQIAAANGGTRATGSGG